MLPVLLTRSRKSEVPGTGRTCVGCWNCAASPWVCEMVRSAVSLATTAELVCDVAMAVNARFPGSAKLTVPVVIGTT